MLLYISAISLFLLATFSLFALIKTWNNRVLLFILSPLIIAAGTISGYSVITLQGTAIEEYPTGEVKLLTATIQKPSMYLVVEHTDTELIKFYKIPYSKDNARQMQKAKRKTDQGHVIKGKFEKDENGTVRYEMTIAPPSPPKPQ